MNGGYDKNLLNGKLISNSKFLYMIAMVLGILSLFLPWVEVEELRIFGIKGNYFTGFKVDGYLILIPLAFVLIVSLIKRYYNPLANMVISIITNLYLLYYWTILSYESILRTNNAAAIGYYLMLVTCLIFTVTSILVYLNKIE